jgi:hypothetical protein
MPEFTVRADGVNVEQIMEQIRSRIREKRGVDYTEEQIRELATVKLEKFLDPRGLRSDLLEQFRRVPQDPAPEPPPNYAFEEYTLFDSHRAPLRWIRRLLAPLLKLFFNPNPLIQALHIQSEINTYHARLIERDAQHTAARREMDLLSYEVLHNLVVETTRMSMEVKNLKMRVESLTSRLEFSERRARALESVVAYRPEAEIRPIDSNASTVRAEHVSVRPATGTSEPSGSVGSVGGPGPGQRSRRRRRRRGRRSEGSVAALMTAPVQNADLPAAVTQEAAEDGESSDHTPPGETDPDDSQ